MTTKKNDSTLKSKNKNEVSSKEHINEIINKTYKKTKNKNTLKNNKKVINKELLKKYVNENVKVHKNNKVISIIKFIIFAFFAILSTYLVISINNLGIIPDKFFALIIIVLIIFNLIATVTLFTKNKWLKIITGLLYIIIGCVSIFGIKYINTTNNFFNNTLVEEENKYDVEYIIISKDKFSENELKDKTVSYNKTTLHVEDAINELSKKYIISFNSVDGTTELLKSSIILIDRTTYDLFIEELGVISASDYNVITSITISVNYEEESTTNTVTENQIDNNSEEETTTTTAITTTTTAKKSSNSYNIFLGAYDFSNSRMDLNKVISINMDTKQMVITNFNRDDYLYSPKYQAYNTLYSLASYGVANNVEAISNALSIKIDYYVTIKTSGMVELVDSIGGIEYCSNQAFTTDHALVLGTYDDTQGEHLNVVEGCQHLNGIETLTVARERRSFSNGSYQRDKNTTAILEDILDKVKSPSIITNYTSILESFSNICRTSIPKDKLQMFVKSFLNDKWSIKTQSVSGTTGHDKVGFSDVINYVEYPDKSSLASCSATINSLSK